MKNQIEFEELKISKKYGEQINRIFYVVKNGRAKVIENFKGLNQDEKDLIKDLISKLATVKNFKSPKIRYNLRGYNYGEIRPKPHRFFFFQNSGRNIIFFEYISKKKNSLKDSFYKEIDKEKRCYEQEFNRFIKGSN